MERKQTMNIDLDKFFQNAPTFNQSDNPRLIYLASPYTDPNPDIMTERLQTITTITKNLIKHAGRTSKVKNRKEYTYFSPVVYSSMLSEITPPTGWYNHMLLFLDKSDLLMVVKMDGWQESKGVQLELAYALGKGIPITYLDNPDYTDMQ